MSCSLTDRTMLLLPCFVVALTFVWSPQEAGDLIVIPESSLKYAPAIQRAVEWQNAVLRRDIPKLVDLTWPEFRDAIRSALHDQSSLLYRRLYVGRSSAISFMNDRGAQRVTVFEHVLNERGPYQVACFFSGRRSKEWPDRYLALQQEVRRGRVFCVDFNYSDTEARWYVSYDFGFPDDAGASWGASSRERR